MVSKLFDWQETQPEAFSSGCAPVIEGRCSVARVDDSLLSGGGVYRVDLEFRPRLPVNETILNSDRLSLYLPPGSKVAAVHANEEREFVEVVAEIPAISPADALHEVARALEHIAINVRREMGRNPLDDTGWLLRASLTPPGAPGNPHKAS